LVYCNALLVNTVYWACDFRAQCKVYTHLVSYTKRSPETWRST